MILTAAPLMYTCSSLVSEMRTLHQAPVQVYCSLAIGMYGMQRSRFFERHRYAIESPQVLPTVSVSIFDVINRTYCSERSTIFHNSSIRDRHLLDRWCCCCMPQLRDILISPKRCSQCTKSTSSFLSFRF
jgi:hypothetical protein